MPRRKAPLKILHLDIETAPVLGFTWSLFPKFIPIDYVVDAGYTLCWCASWEGEREYYTGSIKADGEFAMLERIHALLDEADAVVHYNGTSFDIPVLNREFVRHKMHPPAPYSQIDLLTTVKKQFRFDSNKLDYVCQQLGLGAKEQHKGMKMWRDVMAGKVRAWTTFLSYNKQDVALLKKLYKRLRPWIHNHPTVGLWIEDPLNPVCSTCGSTDLVSKGEQYNTRAASYKRWKCNSCGTALRARLQSQRTSKNVLVRAH